MDTNLPFPGIITYEGRKLREEMVQNLAEKSKIHPKWLQGWGGGRRDTYENSDNLEPVKIQELEASDTTKTLWGKMREW